MAFDADVLRDADRELEAIHRDEPEVASLLARYGDSDRALSRMDELLNDLEGGLDLAPLPDVPKREARSQEKKAAKKKREPKKRPASIPPEPESALRDVAPGEIPPVPPPSVPPPRPTTQADQAVETIERDVANMLNSGSAPPPAFEAGELEALTPVQYVPSVPPKDPSKPAARAITLDDLDVEEDFETSDRVSSPEVIIEAGADVEDFHSAPTSDRAGTLMIDSREAELPPSASNVFQDESDVGPISSVRPGSAPGSLSESDLFDDSAFTEVGEDQSDVFTLEVATGETSVPAGPVLVDGERAADLAALLEGDLDPDEFSHVGDNLTDGTVVGPPPSEDFSANAASDDMGMVIDEEGSIEVQAPVDDEPTSPSVPPPAALESATPSQKPPEGSPSKPPDGTGGPQGKGFFKKIFGK